MSTRLPANVKGMCSSTLEHRFPKHVGRLFCCSSAHSPPHTNTNNSLELFSPELSELELLGLTLALGVNVNQMCGLNIICFTIAVSVPFSLYRHCGRHCVLNVLVLIKYTNGQSVGRRRGIFCCSMSTKQLFGGRVLSAQLSSTIYLLQGLQHCLQSAIDFAIGNLDFAND